MSSSVKNVYQFRTTSKITQGQGATSTFDIGNDIFTNTAVTITAGSVKLENRTGSQVELMTLTATGWTATIATRGILPDGTTSTDYQYERPRNTLCTVTILEDQLFNKKATETVSGDVTYEGNLIMWTTSTTKYWFKAKNLTTAQISALSSPPDGAMVVDTTAWQFQVKIWWSFQSMGAAASTPNASTTVAGKVEVATAAQVTAWTLTGETGALLTATPDVLSAQVQGGSRVYCASTTGSDTYLASLTPALTAYTTGMLLPCKFTTTNTGACSININSLWAKSIKTLDGNDPQTGVIRANGVALLQYDWTNMIIMSSDFATTSNKWVIEIATDAEVVTGTDTARAVTPAQVWFTVIPDSLTTYTALLQSADTTRSSASASYVKLKEIVATFAWTYTVYFEMAELSGLWWANAFGRIYKNGVAFGTERNDSDTLFTAYVENLTFAAGDLIQLYVKATWGDTTQVKFFRLYWFIKPLLLTLTVNTD